MGTQPGGERVTLGHTPDPKGGSQASPEPTVPGSEARGDRRREDRRETNSEDTHGASRVAEGGEVRLGNTRGVGNSGARLRTLQRRAGPAEGGRELRRTAASKGGAKRGKEH